MRKTDIDEYFFFDADKMPEAPTIIEIGAYSAHAIKPLSNLYPKGKFIVIEASLDCFNYLIKALQRFPNAIAYNLALSNTDEKVTINEYVEGIDANSSFDRTNEGLTLSKTHSAIGVTLKTLFNLCGMTTIDLLLLNCEGAEIYALQQLLDVEELRNRINQIGLSFHCDHVKIYSPAVKDELLQRLSVYYEIQRGNDPVGYYLLVRK